MRYIKSLSKGLLSKQRENHYVIVVSSTILDPMEFLPKSQFTSEIPTAQARKTPNYGLFFTIEELREPNINFVYSSVALRIAILLSGTLPWTCSYIICILEDYKSCFPYSPR